MMSRTKTMTCGPRTRTRTGTCKLVLEDLHGQGLSRHVARLRRLGVTKFLGGGAIVTGHRTQLTITITDSATTMKIGIENYAASGASINIFGLYPQCDIHDSFVANEDKKNFK